MEPADKLVWGARHRLGPRPYERFVPLLAELASAEPREVALGQREVALGRQSSPERFVEAALFHGVAGQVLAASGDGRLALPSSSVRALEAGHATRMVRGALLRRELPRVGAVLAEACGTAAILIKGPALADHFYTDQEQRPFEDLDFIVPPDRVQAAAAALLHACGYKTVPLRWPASIERHGHAVELSRRLGAHMLGLELHWRISNDPLGLALDHARLSSGAGKLAGAPEILVPGRTEQLLVLAVHLLHHSEKRLIWLIDLAAVARAASEDEWRAAFSLADSLSLGWVLHRALDETERQLRFRRPRPQAASRPHRWGPLRAAQAIGGPIGYHAGHLATLSWPGRAGYLTTGARGRLRRAAQHLTRRS